MEEMEEVKEERLQVKGGTSKCHLLFIPQCKPIPPHLLEQGWSWHPHLFTSLKRPLGHLLFPLRVPRPAPNGCHSQREEE